jgi:hypothetical protein
VSRDDEQMLAELRTSGVPDACVADLVKDITQAKHWVPYHPKAPQDERDQYKRAAVMREARLVLGHQDRDAALAAWRAGGMVALRAFLYP